MTPPPSAAERYEEEMASRLDGVLRSFDAGRTTAFAPADRPGGPPSAAPSWVTLPLALHEAWAGTGAEAEAALYDVLWGQYALFLAIRIQDDLLDGHRGDLRLLFLADRLLVESMETLSSVPGLGTGFWGRYRACLRETVEAILEVGALQAEPGRFQASQLPLHASVGAVFRVGVTALCDLHHRSDEARWLVELQRQVAVFSQILDDLDDVREDLAAGRYTFVVNALTGVEPGAPEAPDVLAERLGAGWMDPSRMDLVWGELSRAADRALAVLPESAPPGVRAVACRLTEGAEELGRHLHAARVAHIFGPGVLAGGAAPLIPRGVGP